MHVEKLTTDFASPDGKMHTFTLGQKTLVVGRNGTGKTTAIGHSLRLALSGSTRDVDGRASVRDPQVLAQFLPAGVSKLATVAQFDNGETGAWGLVRDGSVVHAPLHERAPSVDEERAFPQDAVVDALAGDEKTRRKAFLVWIGGGIDDGAVFAEIPEIHAAKFREIYQTQPGSPATRLVAVGDYAAKRARAVEADADAQDRLIADLASVAGQAPTDEEVAAASTLAEQWAAVQAAALAWEGRPQADLASALASVTEAEHAVRAWDAVRGEGFSASDAVEAHTRARDLLTPEACASGMCPACGAIPGAATLGAWRAYHCDQAEPPALAEWKERQAEADAASLQWRKVLADRRELLARVQGAAATTPVDPGVSLEQATAHARTAREYLSGLERRKGALDTVREARNRAATLRAEKPVYVALVDATGAAVKTLLDRAKGDFLDRVNSYLPDRWRLDLQLSDGPKEVFRLLLTVDGVRTASLLSGTQRDAVCVALAMVVSERGGGAVKRGKGRPKKGASPGVATYTLVVPEDRDRDPETLGELMRAWTDYPGQVVIESTHLPRGRLPAGWTLVDIDAWLQAVLPPKVAAPADAASDESADTSAGESVDTAAAPAEPAEAPPEAPLVGYDEATLAEMGPTCRQRLAGVSRARVTVSGDAVTIFGPDARPEATFSLRE